MASEAITAASAGTWALGDLVVNRMGFGAMRLAQRGRAFAADATPGDRDRAITVLRGAIDLGINHIDTAAFYFSSTRSANELINAALSPYPDDLVIATKVGPGRDPSGAWLPGARPDQLRGQVEENLRQLGRDCLDLVNLRRQEDMESITEHFGALVELRDAGLIRHVGISSVRPEHLTEAQAIAPVVCVQNAYSIASRGADTLVRICAEQRIAFVPFFSIAGSGGAMGNLGSEPDELVAVARAHGATPAQILLAWTLQQGPHILAIPGTGDPDHIVENVAASAITLSVDELARMDLLQRRDR
jgi:aryl-alcohol dehydrogenase-like predicted oxidoreductase